MINELFSQSLKIAGLCGSAGIGVQLLASDDIMPTSWIQGFERMGSFFLIAIFVLSIMWLVNKIIPLVMVALEKTKDQFLDELKEERVAREKSLEAMREMLQAHKSDLGQKMVDVRSAVDVGNKIAGELVDELKKRPCQIK